jgi:hypothetical protein
MKTSIRHGRQYDNGRGYAPATTAGRESGDEPHRFARTLLCITAKLIVEWQS